MLKEFGALIRKSAARIFTSPNRYLSEQTGSPYTLAGHSITAENCLTSSAVAACVRLLSETIASLPLHVYRELGKSKEIATDHPIYDLLHSKPNVFQTSFVWIQQAIAHCLLHGNFCALIERNAAGDPVALWPLVPSGMIVEAVDGTVQYRYAYGGQRNVFAFEDILHFKGLTMNGLVGRLQTDEGRLQHQGRSPGHLARDPERSQPGGLPSQSTGRSNRRQTRRRRSVAARSAAEML